MSSAINAYLNLLRIPFIPFSIFLIGANETKTATQRAEQITRQVTEAATEAAAERVRQLTEQTTQQATEAATRAVTEQVKQLTEQATQRAIEAAIEQVKQLAAQATLPVAGTNGKETATEEERRLPLYEEQLQVQKRPVETGKVRLSKEVVTEQKTINVPVTHEEIVIEQRSGSGQVSQTPLDEGEMIRIPLREEQVNVTKQTVETGEVVLGKRQIQETQQVSDTVRREEARIEREGQVRLQESDLKEATPQPEH